MSRSAIFAMIASVGLVMVFTTGCAHRRPAPVLQPEEPRLDESFDPLSLGLEELPIPQEQSVQAEADTTLGPEASVAQTDTSRREEMVPGYRVQVCATPDEATARAYYHEALMKFLDQGVYLRFDSPYYKVRIGDCQSRFEAEELQQRVQKAGFPDAWVVRTKVYVHPPPREKEPEGSEQP